MLNKAHWKVLWWGKMLKGGNTLMIKENMTVVRKNNGRVLKIRESREKVRGKG